MIVYHNHNHIIIMMQPIAQQGAQVITDTNKKTRILYNKVFSTVC